ncbi:hypothetical protein PSZ46_23520, partial [Shigella flexneri]|nr:hypothetical protein [Shigella flexneri]
KRRSERRYRSLQLAKTLEILLTKFKKYNVNIFNSEILDWIEELRNNAEYIDDGDFSQQIFLLTKNLHHQYIQHCF